MPMRQLFGCAVVIVGAVVFFYAFDAYLVAPWAHGDGPRLTRTWVGTFQTPAGRHGALELALDHTMTTGRGQTWSRRGYGRLAGTARSCGLVNWPRYNVDGGASRSGSDVGIVIAVPRPAPDGLYWHELRGSWSGDSLRLAGVLAAYAGTTHTYHGGAVDENQPTNIALHPESSGEFERLCH